MLKEALELHSHLNPALWDKNQNLLPEVDDRLHKIVNKFQSECMLPLDIVDVHLVGSNASFNYTSHSDLDVHIIVNFDLLDVDKEILTAAYNLQKAQFNRDYDISIHGVNIEMYIEDINSMTASNGIYSLYNKKWIKKPVKKSYPTLDKRFYDTLDRLADKMRKVVSSDDEVEITKNINMLYMMRKNGLATDGEFSIGNLLFKEIRNLGLLDDLKQRLKELQSQELTLEQLNESRWNHQPIELNGEVFDVSLPVGYKDALSIPSTDTKSLEADYISKFIKKALHKSGWVMHHKDHDRKNNDPSNLQLISSDAHKYIHNKVLPLILSNMLSKGLTSKQALDEIKKMDVNAFIKIVRDSEQNILKNSNYECIELSNLTYYD